MKPTSPQKNTDIPRSPVIAVMGHIDHGKSTLLDTIRKTNITAGEAGGITQHVAAYEVIHKDKGGTEQRITFLDTPGHAAFQGIRVRGANVADIAILVVSAEEGVKPQTLEALKCILEAKIPYIVAINKIDSPKADIERTKQSLAENEVYIEGYGGSIPWVPLSAKTGEGISDLLDMMLLVAEMQELHGNPVLNASGVIIETNRDTKKGISATLIIKNGTLKSGQTVVSGESLSPVRLLENFKGEKISEAMFSSPVRLIGFNTLPKIGETFETFDSKRDAEAAAVANKTQAASAKSAPKKVQPAATVGPDGEELPEKVTIPLIIKADVAGTMEAIEGELKKLGNDRVTLKIVQSGIGGITEVDVKNAIGMEHVQVIGFSTRIDPQARSIAERSGITIMVFDIIYKLTEWLEELVKQSTPKIEVAEIDGRAKILKIFSRTKDKQIVGGRVLEGVIAVGEEIKIKRRDAEIGTGRIREMQQQKQKTSEAKKDTEFGCMIESKNEIAPGDVIEAFKMVVK